MSFLKGLDRMPGHKIRRNHKKSCENGVLDVDHPEIMDS
jgi:hypothetical protein